MDGWVQLRAQDVRIEGRVFLASEGMDVSAEDVDDLGDIGRRAGGRALEDEVLEKVRRPAVLLRLHRRAAAECEAKGDGTDVGEGLDEDRQPRRKHMPGDGRWIRFHGVDSKLDGANDYHSRRQARYSRENSSRKPNSRSISHMPNNSMIE